MTAYASRVATAPPIIPMTGIRRKFAAMLTSAPASVIAGRRCVFFSIYTPATRLL